MLVHLTPIKIKVKGLKLQKKLKVMESQSILEKSIIKATNGAVLKSKFRIKVSQTCLEV